MYCNQCGNRNPRGSRFCRHCGVSLTTPGAARAIPDEEYAVSRSDPAQQSSRIHALLDSSFAFSENGDLPAAIHACQQAILLEPTSATAHSFLALLYERSGQFDRAIEEYERAVNLNPQSTLDRDSLERLRQKLNPADSPTTTVTPGHSSPYFDTTPVVAAATFAIMLLLGVHNYVNGRTQVEEERKHAARVQAQDNRPPAANLGTMRPNVAIPPTRMIAQLPVESVSPPTGTPPNPLNNPAPPANAPAPNPQSPNASSTPNEQPNGRWVDVPINPGRRVVTGGNGAGMTAPNFNLPRAGTGARANPADAMPAQSRPLTTNDTGENRPGNSYIKVTVGKAPDGKRSSEEGPSSSGSDSGDPPRAASNERIANQRFLRGDLDGAIESYKQALETTNGELAGPLHQQLAGAYIKKKQTAEAVAEYRKALESYRLQKNAGIQVSAAEKGMDSCQKAINLWELLLK